MTNVHFPICNKFVMRLAEKTNHFRPTTLRRHYNKMR